MTLVTFGRYILKLTAESFKFRASNWGFHKYTTLAIMPILALEALLCENKIIQQQNVAPSGNRTTGLGFQVQHAPCYTNLTFACNTETLGSLYSHALLILTGSSKTKSQVVHEQMFKDLPSSKCPVSVERSMLDLET